jgi:fumarylacetoacetase
MYVVDPRARSFIATDADDDFPLQNLPYGVFRPPGSAKPRVGVAIGDAVLDLSVLEDAGLLDVPQLPQRGVFHEPALNAFLAAGRAAWEAVRRRLVELLHADEPRLRDDAALRRAALVPRSAVRMLLPAQVGDYTDFYSSREHATNVGTMLRGADNALQPNWLHLPVAYHGRSSSLVVSGTDIRRPCGQIRPQGSDTPRFGPSRALDYELEMGFFVGPGNALGEPIPIDRAEEHIFGFVLVNDWSARDIQAWEYQPLGPFVSKNFATSVSPWVVTLDALEPFRVCGPPQDPTPLPYLQTDRPWAYDIVLQATLRSSGMREELEVCRSNFRYLYWSAAQQLAHHTITGCNLRPGDLLASGTISGPDPESRACLLERTWQGTQPLQLPDGTQRRFLEDGDCVTLRAWSQGDGYRIGFGELRGTVLPAPTS